MQVYLTGVNIKKSPSIKSNTKEIKALNKKVSNEKFDKLKEETKVLNEGEISSEQVRLSFITSKDITSKTNQLISSNDINNNIETNKLSNKINNNFISNEDKNKKNTKKKYLSEIDFSKMRQKSNEIKKNNKLISDEIKEEYVEYIMLKEPKYADFDKIGEDYQNQIYNNYQKYNTNLLIIARKKEEIKHIVSLIEKSLVNNYFLKDSSMLPVYEKMIEKVKYDILTKKQEHDGYHKLYEELYNQNYTIKRKVLDEIDIDCINENFYDQYKILKNHAIVQVSKKQEVLNQIEEYQKKVLQDHDKELKQKNKTLKDLRLQIAVFKEDEKDLINKLERIKKKRIEIIEKIKEKKERNETIHNSLGYLIKRYHKSYISMNNIFKSVNAQNLDDVLLDVSNIKSDFNRLKNRIVDTNKKISYLNSDYSKFCLQLQGINNDIIIEENKRKTTYQKDDQKRVEEIRNELKGINEEKNKIQEIIQNSIGTFQQGITFLFQKIKLMIRSIKTLKKIISPNLEAMINKYKYVPFSVDYNNINRDFLKTFTYIFFKFSHIIFYLYLNSMSSGVNISNLNKKYQLTSLYNENSLRIYEAGIKKSLETYDRRRKLKREKQSEINALMKKKEIQKKLKKDTEEDDFSSQNKMFKRFVNYLQKKHDPQKDKSKNNNNYYLNSRESGKNSTSFFFTGIDFAKPSKDENKDSSKTNSLNSTKRSKFRTNFYKEKINIPFTEKQDFLMKNQNKLKGIFNKYQNVLIKENDRNLFIQKKLFKKFPRSNSQPQVTKKINFSNFTLMNKKRRGKNESEKPIAKPTLMDEDYEYDEDENENNKMRSTPLKKNKTLSNFIFFKLNKDRANIYKNMNDLRKLQMAYFGGRFLNTNINSVGQSLRANNNAIDELASNYLKGQNKNNLEADKKMRDNLRKKLVDKITANKRLRDKTSFLVNKKNKNIFRNDYKGNNSIERYRKVNNKINYSTLNKKSTSISTKNDKTIYKNSQSAIRFKYHSKSINDENSLNSKKIKFKNRTKSIKKYSKSKI